MAGRSGEARPRSSRRDDILTMSKRLFNERGVTSVSTNYIAERMGISPGNLYYYFRNRDDIVLALFDQLESATVGVVVPLPSPVTPEAWAALFLDSIEVVWDNRFIFAHVGELAAGDTRLRRRVTRLTGRTLDATETVLRAMVDARHLRAPEHPDDLRRLAHTAFVVYWNWPAFVAVTTRRTAFRSADVFACALHGHLIFEPYLDRDFAVRARTVIEREVERRAVRTTARR